MEGKELIRGVQHLGIPVVNVDRAAAFYVEKLDMELIQRKVAVDAAGGYLEVAFVKKNDLVLELYKPSGSEAEIEARGDGVLDHYAFDAPDLENCRDKALDRGMQYHASTKDGIVWYEHVGPKGVRGVNFTGPNKEVIEFCQDLSKSYNGQKGLLGWSHLALKVRSLEQSVSFYEKLGFQKYADGYLDTPQGRLIIGFVELNGFLMEIIQVCPAMLEEQEAKKAGHIDHFALDVKDVVQMCSICRREGFKLLTPAVKELTLLERGIRYIMIEGPDGERIEFNQKL